MIRLESRLRHIDAIAECIGKCGVLRWHQIENFDGLLTRSATAEALSAAGSPVRSATFAAKASRGGGPFRRFGRMPFYRWGDALD
jgi:hypothetical protein